jgi:hypothetical protein
MHQYINSYDHKKETQKKKQSEGKEKKVLTERLNIRQPFGLNNFHLEHTNRFLPLEFRLVSLRSLEIQRLPFECQPQFTRGSTSQFEPILRGRFGGL